MSEKGERTFRNAVIGGGEMTLWVTIDRFAMVARCPLYTR
jgi:hypothetical protein